MGIGKAPFHPDGNIWRIQFSPYLSPYFQLEQGKWQEVCHSLSAISATSRNSALFSFSIRRSICAISRTTIGKFSSTAVYTAQQEMSQTSALLPIGQTTVPGKTLTASSPSVHANNTTFMENTRIPCRNFSPPPLCPTGMYTTTP